VPAFLNIQSNTENQRIECADIITIGRDKKNTLTIKDGEMSRNHAMIKCLALEQYYLFDIGSRNGCSINGLRINAPTHLKSGDIIGVGNTTIVFEQFIIPVSQQEYSQTSLAVTIVSESSSIKSIVVLVGDIRGYTTMSEKLPISVLSSLMSKWFDDVQKIIGSNQGRVDKFIGDCVMAIWEIKDDSRQKVLSAMKAAYEIFSYTGKLHMQFPEIENKIKLGIGIHTGKAALGIGLDNTAMGDTVNLAFRLESATKSLKCDLIMSESTYKHLPKNLWHGREHEIRVKGKKNKTKICTLNLS